MGLGLVGGAGVVLGMGPGGVVVLGPGGVVVLGPGGLIYELSDEGECASELAMWSCNEIWSVMG